ncbi:MAG: hypothetical protein Ct9H300mP12_16320 [Acidimicrobiales bacterium]|nr:MAG: hypothetical protein Ct9H300mP12_16320 [Acidimicrobiales bacterium]
MPVWAPLSAATHPRIWHLPPPRRGPGGQGTVKVKVAASPFPTDLARLTAVREAIGDKRLRIDANGGWAPGEASEHLARLAALDLELVEEPGARGSKPWPRSGRPHRSRWQSRMGRTIDDVRGAHRTRQADLVVLKPSALGGPRVTAEVARWSPRPVGALCRHIPAGRLLGIRSAAHRAAALGAWTRPRPGPPPTLLTADSGPHYFRPRVLGFLD